jgi:DNA-binding response OmpR family regulator
MGSEKRALLIEDDRHIIDLLTLHLRDLGFATFHATSGGEGLKRALQKDHDLIILDLMLPDLDGFEVCKRIREENKQVPLLMLTARAEELDKVLGLELGADDYITKPFSIRELIARVKALVRRVETDRSELAPGEEEVLREGELTIHLANRTVERGGRKIELTRKEFDLLALLARNPGRAFNRQQLLDTVWGYQYEGYNHTVNSHINRLRSKIEIDPSNPAYIQTVWGYGYRFSRKGDRNR